jgi:hypothetical protein
MDLLVEVGAFGHQSVNSLKVLKVGKLHHHFSVLT